MSDKVRIPEPLASMLSQVRYELEVPLSLARRVHAMRLRLDAAGGDALDGPTTFEEAFLVAAEDGLERDEAEHGLIARLDGKLVTDTRRMRRRRRWKLRAVRWQRRWRSFRQRTAGRS